MRFLVYVFKKIILKIFSNIGILGIAIFSSVSIHISTTA